MIKGVFMTVSKAEIMKKFERKGRYENIRAIYFKKRDSLRERELEELERDVDYLIAELKRLERRTGVYSLVSTSLMHMMFQLYYMRHRKSIGNDAKLLRKISDTFCYSYSMTRLAVFSQVVETTDWLTRDKGGEEPDCYVPNEIIAVIPKKIKINNKRLHDCTKEELIDMIAKLSHQLQTRGEIKKENMKHV